MMRDANGVQSVLQKAGSMGRGGDDQMAHIGTGEILIPPEVVDNYPQILPQVVKAFQNAGLDWRKYMAGGENQKNPSTGAPEFFAGQVGAKDMDRGLGDRNPGGEQGDKDSYNIGSGGYMVDDTPDTITYDPDTGVTGSEDGRDVNVGGMPDMGQDPGFNPKDMLSSPGGPIGYGIKQAAKHMFSGPGYSPAGGMAATIGGRAMNRDSGGGGGIGDGAPGSGLEKNLFSAPSGPVTMPSYLEFAPGMTDLQRRAQIATYALNSDDSRYGTQETQDYYKSLIQGMAYEDLLPIEQQYLTQVLGIPPGQSISAAKQVSGGNPLVGDMIAGLSNLPG